MYKTCIFDLDGTLTDTLESLTYSVNKTLQELGLHSITSDQCRRFVGNGAKVLIEEALKAAGDIKLTHMEQAVCIYGRIFDEHCTFRVTPYEGIIEVLKTLKGQGVKMGVLSNKPHLQAVHVVEEILGAEVFGAVKGQCDEILRKPDPAGIFYVAAKLGVAPKDCIYIGDSEVDIKTGLAAGISTIGVTWGFRSREVLLNAGAMNIADNPKELLGLIERM